jgi:citrate lyase subunit beta / citryl-CoA lyase
MANPAGRRSCLSVPGSSESMIRKALQSAAHEVVIDLEDAVAPDHKPGARDTVVRLLSAGGHGEKWISVRVNAAGTPWSHEDLTALGSLPHLPHSVVLPKVESAGDVAYADRLLAGAGHGRTAPPIRIQALIESAAGLQNLGEIARASDRLEALILGYADLGADLGRSPGSDFWGPARDHLLWAARAQGLLAIDGPWLDVADDTAFQQAVAEANGTGFDAKWVIHPRQIDTVNRIFQPTEEDISWALRVVDALDQAERTGVGAVQLDGAMLDAAVALRARRVLAGTGADA